MNKAQGHAANPRSNLMVLDDMRVAGSVESPQLSGYLKPPRKQQPVRVGTFTMLNINVGQERTRSEVI